MPVGNVLRAACAAVLPALAFAPVLAQVPLPTFSPQTIDSSLVAPWGKSSGDVDGDGDLDLLAQGNEGGGLAWYRNPGWARTSISAEGGFRTDMEVVDVNNDGRADVVSTLGDQVVWFEQPASGPQTAAWPLRVIAGDRIMHDLEVADLDGNCLVDVVVRNQSAFGGTARTVYVYEQTSPGVFRERALDVGVEGEGLHLADLDRDGRQDIVVNTRWLRNPGRIQDPWPMSTYTATWTNVHTYIASGDVNRDGRVDLVLSPAETGEGNYRISWFEAPADPAGIWAERVVSSSIQTLVHFVGVADFNRDGLLDIASAETSQSDGNDEVSIHLNDGASGWTKSVIWNNGSHSMRVGDFDNDGDPDLFGANWTTRHGQDEMVRIWWNTSPARPLSTSGWRLHTIDAQKPSRSVFLVFADADRDGRTDILTGAWWYRNPGSLGSAWTRSTLPAPVGNVILARDFDADGDADLLATRGFGSDADGRFAWVRNDPGGLTALTNITSSGGDFPQGVAAGKIVCGGSQVLLSWHEPGRPVEMLSPPANPSAGTWPLAPLAGVSSQDEALTASDIDHDGDLDVFQGTRWLQNQGGGNFLQFTANPVAGNPDRHKLIDVDQDGDLDAVVGFEGSSTSVIWLERPANPRETWPLRTIATGIGGGYSLDAADVDRDGDADVVVGEHQGATRLLLFLNQGRGTSWTTQVIHPGGSGFDHHDGAALIDLDRDGDSDIVSIGWHNASYVWVFENLATAQPPPPPTAPAIARHPADQTVAAGGSATFSVEASGTAPLAFQWQRNRVDIPGATAASYTVASAAASDSGARYRCIVSNAAGTATSNEAVLHVAGQPPPPPPPPPPGSLYEAEAAARSGAVVASNHPGYSGTGFVDYVASTGEYVEWTVTSAAGARTLKFRYANGGGPSRPLRITVNGVVASASLAFPSTGAWSAWSFATLAVNLGEGSNLIRATSIGSSGPNLDYLQVEDGQSPPPPTAPAITRHPADQTVAAGESATFSVEASGTAPLAFQWQRNRVDIPGATAASYTVASAAASDSGAQFRCRVSNAAGTATSNEAVLRVTSQHAPPPPPPPGETVILQAETATLVGAEASSANGGFTGSGYADYVNETGDYVEWSVTRAQAGSGTLEFRYALAFGTRSLRITVNGAVVSASLAFTATGSWTAWQVLSLPVSLVSGTNTVRAEAIGTSGPNVDYLGVK